MGAMLEPPSNPQKMGSSQLAPPHPTPRANMKTIRRPKSEHRGAPNALKQRIWSPKNEKWKSKLRNEHRPSARNTEKQSAPATTMQNDQNQERPNAGKQSTSEKLEYGTGGEPRLKTRMRPQERQVLENKARESRSNTERASSH